MLGAMLGKVIGGRYKLLYFLGGGGFGYAYFARDQDFSTEGWCLVKQMSFGNPLSPMSREERIQRFKQEAETLNLLGEYDKIPRLHDYFEENEQFYLVEDFIDGHNLEEELSNFKLSEYEVYSLVKDVLETLEFVQEKNIIHRDITPDNLIRRLADRKIVLIDFGAVKRIISEDRFRRSPTISIGKEVYMPDEQASGRPRRCSDIYAIGIIGIQACIGDTPEKDYDSGELIWRGKVSINPNFANILEKMTSCNWRNRYQIASEVLIDLDKISSEINKTSTSNFYRKNYAKIWYVRGNEMRNKKLHEEAIFLYKKAIEIKRDYYKALFNIGVTFSYLKKYEDAIEYYDKALAVKPQSAETLLHKAIALGVLNRLIDAFQVFQDAFSLKKTNKSTRIYKRYADSIALDANCI
ncbi:protein kinase [Geitlerinema splendidum]|nr:protein kinase [Geitlerinema splendidum]